MKVALTHDWLTGEGGAEQVVLALHKLYPKAPIFTSVWNRSATPSFAGLDVRTSFLQHWPLAQTRHQLYPLLRPRAFRAFDLSEYDVVISSSSAEAKDLKLPPRVLHICYCHTPIRYYWSDYEAYLNRMEFGALNPLIRLVMPQAVRRMRRTDYAAAQRVDAFVANSDYVAARIKQYYHRPAQVIYPPVRVDQLDPGRRRKEYYLSLSRLVPYKRVDLAVEAATQLGIELKVAGTGPELPRLKKLAGPTVQFLGRVTEEQKRGLYEDAKALIFPAEEDFGIAPVEAMAAGCPVILYGKGGAIESVRDDREGVYFTEQTKGSLEKAIEKFDHRRFDPKKLRQRAEFFSAEQFSEAMRTFVTQAYKTHRDKG